MQKLIVNIKLLIAAPIFTSSAFILGQETSIPRNIDEDYKLYLKYTIGSAYYVPKYVYYNYIDDPPSSINIRDRLYYSKRYKNYAYPEYFNRNDKISCSEFKKNGNNRDFKVNLIPKSHYNWLTKNLSVSVYYLYGYKDVDPFILNETRNKLQEEVVYMGYRNTHPGFDNNHD